MFTKAWKARHLEGPGGISRLLILAYPIIISNASDTIMMFCDRYFLSHLGSEYMSGAMIAGFSCFFLMTFWYGVNSYVNALVAQHYGAKQIERCAVAVSQGLIFSVMAYPIILTCVPFIYEVFEWSSPDPLQLILQKEYFLILTLASPFALFRVVFGSFFAGIGRTRIVMIANLLGMILNIPLTYAMVFGVWGFPEWKMAGAAYGTAIGEALTFVILAVAYIRENERFHIWKNLYFDRKMFSKLLRFGFPAGFELFIAMAALNLTMQQFHSYGTEVAAAMTITFNWDLVAFLPMMGLGIAVTSLVGQNLGANNTLEAERALFSGLKVAMFYALSMTLLFLFGTDLLVNIFLHDHSTKQYAEIYETATVMLRLAALFITADALKLMVVGALHGAGDTLWPMWVKVLIYPFFAVVVISLIKVYKVAPVIAWGAFTFLPISLAIILWYRYKSGAWKTFKLLAAA
ncbi:MAG: MATE family multidrug resistance protein [Chlamydiales bacterium]|jgi:MATE family multidrug resistance protein